MMGTALANIDKRDLRELLTKGWMTHDAMWFYHSIHELGVDRANKVNIAAVESMSAIEIRRLKKALGYSDAELTSFDRLADFAREAFDIIKADFMHFEFETSEKNILRWKWMDGKCFAFEGVTALGCIDEYKCGIIKRIEGWFTGLGIKYKMEPPVDRCLMHHKGECVGRFIFELE